MVLTMVAVVVVAAGFDDIGGRRLACGPQLVSQRGRLHITGLMTPFYVEFVDHDSVGEEGRDIAAAVTGDDDVLAPAE